MKNILPIIAFLATASACAAEPDPVIAPVIGPSLCAANEQILWTCVTKQPTKMAALCASKPVNAKQGYVQYRFGTAKKVELVFPDKTNATQQQFLYGRYTRPMETRLAVRFTHGTTIYTLQHENADEEKPHVPHSWINAGGFVINCHESGTLMNMEDVVPNKDWIDVYQ